MPWGRGAPTTAAGTAALRLRYYLRCYGLIWNAIPALPVPLPLAVPSTLPEESIVTLEYGLLPSLPEAKRCRTFSRQLPLELGESSKTVPQPMTQLPL